MTESHAVTPLLSRWFDAPVEAVLGGVHRSRPAGPVVRPRGRLGRPRLGRGSKPRPGGPWALTMLMGDRSMPLSGTVTEVREGERLVVTDAMPDGSLVTMTVELTEEDGGTRLELRQGPFPAARLCGCRGRRGVRRRTSSTRCSRLPDRRQDRLRDQPQRLPRRLGRQPTAGRVAGDQPDLAGPAAVDELVRGPARRRRRRPASPRRCPSRRGRTTRCRPPRHAAYALRVGEQVVAVALPERGRGRRRRRRWPARPAPAA